MENSNNEKIAIEKLEQYFHECFPAFKTAFQTGFKKWSDLPIAAELCESMHLCVTLYFKLTEKKTIGFLITEEGFKSGIDDSKALTRAQEKYPNMQIKQARYCRIENTGLEEASDYFSEVKEIVWTLIYKKEDTVHKIIAGVILDLLGENIHNLNEIKDYNQQQIGAFFQNKQFMEYYIRKMQELFAYIPDHRSITDVLISDYENRRACGTVCYIKDNAEIKQKIVCFDETCCLTGGFNEKTNTQRIRKLLEICRDTECCLAASAESGNIIGIIPKETDLQHELEFSIEFAGNQWELRCGSETLLKYRSGNYCIDSANENEKLRGTCVSAGIEYDIFEKMIRLLEEKAVHGALIIIAQDAEAEVERLCQKNRGIKIDKRKVSEQTVLGMTNADGAVFFDYDGNCYGFNIILDGIAVVEGEIGRGARYNSAVNYINCANIKATKGDAAEGVKRCAIIRSEDKEKGIEIISNDKQNNNTYSSVIEEEQ